MKSLAALLMAPLFLLAPVEPANADNCQQAARAEARAHGPGTIVVSVRPINQNGQVICDIRLSVPGKKSQPPRIVTVRVGG
jgi:hypothetical protein